MAQNGGGPAATTIGQLAQKYGQPVQPLVASENSINFDSSSGVSAVAPPFQQFADTADGQQEILEQLAEGLQLLERLTLFPPTPEGLVQAGLVGADEKYSDWAAATNLSIFTGLSELLINSALTGPSGGASAGAELNEIRNYSLGSVRQAFIGAGDALLCSDAGEVMLSCSTTVLQ